MATDYDKVYRDSRHALGAPTKEFVSFFESYQRDHATVLDVGCGQGRDALFIARLGHSVTGIDQSPSGIRDLLKDASIEGLEIEAEVADIRDYLPYRSYDIVLIDRTLHMLKPEERLSVLRKLLACTSECAAVLIADERSNISSFESVFTESESDWMPILKRRGYLFFQRN